MDKETELATQILEKKRAALAQEKENMLTWVRSLISTGKFELIAAKRQKLEDMGLETEVDELLKVCPIPCPECGQDMARAVMFCRVYPNCPDCNEKASIANNAARVVARDQSVIGLRNHLAETMETVLTKCGVSKRYLHAKIQDFPESSRKLATIEDGLFLTGDRGTGKTHLAVALMRDCILTMQPEIENDDENTPADRIKARLPWKPRFVSIPELLLQIRATFGKTPNASWQMEAPEETEEQIIGKYSTVPFLVMDDMGVEKTSDWSMQTLYTIIDRRYREMRKTIITSNLTLDEIARKLDDRISSRIAGMCRVVPLKGKDRRISR